MQTATSSSRRRWLVPLACAAVAIPTFVAFWVVALAGLFLAAGIRGESGITYGALLVLAEATHLAALAILNRKGGLPTARASSGRFAND